MYNLLERPTCILVFHLSIIKNNWWIFDLKLVKLISFDETEQWTPCKSDLQMYKVRLLGESSIS